MQNTSRKMLGSMKHKLESRLPWEISITSEMQHHPYGRKQKRTKEELKSLLRKVKEESEKVGLKINIQKMKIMASGPITSWKIDGEQWKQWETISLGSKITTDGDCSHEIKSRLFLGWEAMTNLDRILKSRDITSPKKVRLVKAMVFPVAMYGRERWDYKESWAPKNWCFWTVVLEKTLESLLDCKEIKPVNPKGNQSWIFTGRTDPEAPILWPPDAKNWLTGKDLMLKKTEDRRRRGRQDEMVGWHHQHDGQWVWVGSRSWWWTGKPGVLQSMGLQRVRHNWTSELKLYPIKLIQILHFPPQIMNSKCLVLSKQENTHKAKIAGYPPSSSPTSWFNC